MLLPRGQKNTENLNKTWKKGCARLMWSLMWMWWCKRVNKLWNWRIGRRIFSIYSFFYKTGRLKIHHLNKSFIVLSIFIVPTYLKKYLTRADSIINFHVDVTSCAAKTDWKSIAKICPPTICRMLYSQFSSLASCVVQIVLSLSSQETKN